MQHTRHQGSWEDKKLHELIDTLNPKLRLAKNREFFAMSAEKAYRLLEAIAIISGSADKLKRVVPIQGEGAVSSTRKQPHCQGSSGRKRSGRQSTSRNAAYQSVQNLCLSTMIQSR
ncbi:MAG: hypothetical protein ACLTS6_09430 [Anaerobutyricum sp.]